VKAIKKPELDKIQIQVKVKNPVRMENLKALVDKSVRLFYFIFVNYDVQGDILM